MDRAGRKILRGLFALLLVFSTQGLASGGNDHDHSKDSEPQKVASADWKAKLKAQLLREEKEQGQEGRKSKVDAAMGTLMNEIMGHQEKTGNTGPFGEVTAMMQMDRSWFLGPSGASETVTGGGHCPSNAPVKKLDITAINVEITLNQWLDFHPGYMYVLTENVKGVREEERTNNKARKAKGYDPGAVTLGLQTDLIQPLVIRGNQGDCMLITLRNEVEEEDVGLHIHGSSTVINKTGQPATSINPDSNISPGNSVVLEWYIQPDHQEGGHVFHSHAGREPGSLGLIGAFIVEPIGAIYLDPITGKPAKSGWQMMIAYDDKIEPVAKDFREFTLIYHEVGDESFRPLNRDGEMIPQRDPNTDAYRPSARAINFRSEPFGINNLAVQEKYFHMEDESMAYSSYTFGDVPTTIPRSYMGDPAKFRLIHGGGEVFHSHHPHGGSIRWLRQPKADGKGEELLTTSWDNPVKFPVIRTISDRVDVEVIGPSESVDLQTECGSGLCQQLAGDFLFHCHVAHHYVAGMWGYWRVYNTIQSGDYPFVSTDAMVPLKELPDRAGRMKKGVSSKKLVGKTMNWFDKKWNITKKTSDWSKPIPDVSIKDWVKMMLPPAGEPGHTSDEKGQILAYDATVWDWTWKGLTAMSEKGETGQFDTPKHKSPLPGKRAPILFDPNTGKTSWPHFRPHFGKRVPFARHHGGSPWLEPIHMDKNNNTPATDPGSIGAPGEETTLPPEPGEQGRWSLCPEGAGRKQYTIHFIQTPITMNDAIGKDKRVIDKDGTIYVLHEDVAKVRANSDLARPLAYRINIYDCLDVILKSEWVDNNPTNFQMSKINIHTHFIQFDNQASDGVISGFSYDQSVRPFTMLGKKEHRGLPAPMNALQVEDTAAGAISMKIKMGEHATPFHVDTDLMFGMHQVETSEIRWVRNIEHDAATGVDTLTFSEPLKHAHKKDEIVSTEWVRYRLWADADVGTVFWHDHALGGTTWPHGAVGAFIVEPVGSTYHDPVTGDLIRSGPIADIRTMEPIGFGQSGSFREVAMFLHDTVPFTAQVVTEGNPPGQSKRAAIDAGQVLFFQMPYDLDYTAVPMLNGGTHTTGGGIFFKTESIAKRLKHVKDPSLVFSSRAHKKDPGTNLIRAYLGDTVTFRMLHVMMNETHVWRLAGHPFRTERYAGNAEFKNAYHIGIAERYDFVVTAGSAQKMAGDYLYYNARPSHLAEGSWGIFRVLDEKVKDLQVLPGHEVIPRSAKTLCPSDAPVKRFNVVATDHALKFNPNAPDVIEVDFDRKLLVANPKGKIFILEGEMKKIAAGAQPHPLTLHVNSGDCIKIRLKNNLKGLRASFSADGLAFDPNDSHGVDVGYNKGNQTVAPGKTRTYTFYAPPEFGEFSTIVWDWGNFMNSTRDGLFGGIIVGPRGSKYRDSVTGEDVTMKNSWAVDVILDRSNPKNAGRSDYRDVSLYFQDEDNIIGTAFMPYIQQIAGLAGVNYRSEPWMYREENGCELGTMFQPCVAGTTELATPTILAHAGDPVRIHVFGAFNEQNQMFAVENHQWPLDLGMARAGQAADLMPAEEFGSSEHMDVFLRSAGGPTRLPGIYLWQTHRLPYTAAGLWGYFKVLPTGSRAILPLNSGGGASNGRTAELEQEAPEVISGLGDETPGPLSMLEK
ncbi:MAG: multicopper oxidase domain-containing protein [Nitrospira sp.]|nr:hypothetical protein [Candidatus Manganitrophaceae bacterium]HIL35177.1 hypothetical protein [Candidatus Manganitrophaceae bacterium]